MKKKCQNGKIISSDMVELKMINQENVIDSIDEKFLK
jgi:hypothetical protein